MRLRPPQKLIGFRDVQIERETEKALLVDFGDTDPIWIPKSQIKAESDDGEYCTDIENGEIVITEWIAQQKGLA